MLDGRGPERRIAQLVDRIADLIFLYGSVDEQADVVDTQTDDLNGVLESECIPPQDQFVHKAEDEEGEVGGDGANVWCCCRSGFEALLKDGKDIATRGL